MDIVIRDLQWIHGSLSNSKTENETFDMRPLPHHPRYSSNVLVVSTPTCPGVISWQAVIVSSLGSCDPRIPAATSVRYNHILQAGAADANIDPVLVDH